MARALLRTLEAAARTLGGGAMDGRRGQRGAGGGEEPGLSQVPFAAARSALSDRGHPMHAPLQFGLRGGAAAVRAVHGLLRSSVARSRPGKATTDDAGGKEVERLLTALRADAVATYRRIAPGIERAIDVDALAGGANVQ